MLSDLPKLLSVQMSKRAERLTTVFFCKGIDENCIEAFSCELQQFAVPFTLDKVLPSAFQDRNRRPIIHTRLAHVSQNIGMSFDNDMIPHWRLRGRLEELVYLPLDVSG